jgi:hypothetical protein
VQEEMPGTLLGPLDESFRRTRLVVLEIGATGGRLRCSEE